MIAEEKTSLTVIDAIKALAAVCDGATSKDGQGFNKFDREEHANIIDKAIAGEPISPGEEKKAHSLLKKYKKQLKGLGINYDDIGHIPRQGSQQQNSRDAEEDYHLTPEKCLIKQHDGQTGECYIKGINYDSASAMILENFDVFRVVENKETFVYLGGVYCMHGWEVLENHLYDVFKGYRKKNGQSAIDSKTVTEILNRTFSLNTITVSALETPSTLLNLPNGILDLDAMAMQNHTPDIYMLTQSPVEYVPGAECPEFMKFLDQAVDSKYHDLIGEIIGYMMWPEYHIQKAFMFLGPRRTGKGTLLRVIQAVIGEDDCSHQSLQDLCGHKFARASLFGRKINTYGDLPATPIIDPGIFKGLTGEDTIEAENKFEKSFRFKNTAKLLFSANNLPMLKTDDDAFYGRWIIVPFNYSVYGREDPDLTKRLTTPEELRGVLNFGLEGLARLRRNSWRFSYEDNAEAMYRRKSKPIIAFLEDRCEASDTDYVVKADLLAAYNTWAKSQGLPSAPSKKAFGSAMQDQTTIPVDTSTPRVGDKQVEAWSGIRLKK